MQANFVWYHVRSLPIHYMKKDGWKYKCLGRILSHTVALTGNLPPVLSRCTPISIIFNSSVEDCCVMQDFFSYVNINEAKLLKKALSDFSALSVHEMEQLGNFFISHQFYDVPRGSEIEEQILAIASQVMALEATPLCQLMRSGIPQTQMLKFEHWTYKTHARYAAPHTRKSGIKVQCSPTNPTNDETRVVYFLEEFIRSLDNDTLLVSCTSQLHRSMHHQKLQ